MLAVRISARRAQLCARPPASRALSSRGGLAGTAAAASPLAPREKAAESRWATENDAALTAALAAKGKGAIRSVGVIGLGLMGHGIMQTAASAGCAVVGVDTPAGAERGLSLVRASLAAVSARAAKKEGAAAGAAAEAAGAAALARLRTSADVAAVADCDLVIEAVPETFEAKTPVYAALGRVLQPGRSIIASNTSGLPVTALAALAGAAWARRFIGLHYFNPVQIMQLVEVIPLPDTEPAVTAAALAFVRACGKTPVVARDTPGFVVNRLLVPYMAQAFKLVDDGVATFQDVDVAMKLGAGHPMGPFTLADYVGLDTTLSILKNWRAAHPAEPAFIISPTLVDLVAQGKLGRKTGQGFYKWNGNSPVLA